MQEQITAYADGELNGEQRQSTEKHLAECAKCAAMLASISAMKQAMRADALLFNAPGSLLTRIESLVDKAADPVAPRHPTKQPPRHRLPLHGKWLSMGIAAVVILAAGISGYFLWPSATERLEADAVAIHQQAIQNNHLVDLTTSDPVKLANWFMSRTSFAPMIPVPRGMTLVGGRMDKLDGSDVAVLVFRNGATIAEVLQRPSHDGMSPTSTGKTNGANVAAWNTGGMQFVIVSGGGAAPVNELIENFTAQGCGPH